MHSILGRLSKRGSVGLIPQRTNQRNQRKFDQQMVTGSLSLGGSGSVYPHSSTSTQPQQQDDMKQSTTSSMKYQDRDEKSNKSIEKSSSLFSMPSRKEGRKSSSDGGNLPISMSLSSSHHNEPQITPSISNIGGAVLRSKTADFERLLVQSKKSNSGSASESSVQVQTADTITTEATASGQVKKQPIYKRKELISSVQSSKK